MGREVDLIDLHKQNIHAVHEVSKLIYHIKFAVIVAAATEDEMDALRMAVIRLRASEIRKIRDQIANRELDALTRDELRWRASANKIPYYGSMNNTDLRKAIKNAEQGILDTADQQLLDRAAAGLTSGEGEGL